MRELKLTRDSGGQICYGLNFSDDGQIANLAAGATGEVAIPEEAELAYIQVQPGAVVLVGTGDTAPTAPTGNFAPSNADINAAIRSITSGETKLQFRAITASVVKVSFYSGKRK